MAHFLNNIFHLFIFLWFLNIFLLSILMVTISLDLTRFNPDRNIFSIKCGTNTCFIYSTQYTGFVHPLHRILNLIFAQIPPMLIYTSQQKDFDIKFDLDPLPLIGQPLILPFLLHLTLDPVHHQINIYFNMNFI